MNRSRRDRRAGVQFAYEEAFCRNIGVVDEGLQARVRYTRVGMAGLGGSGGCCAEALVRLGIGAMHLADPDVYELVNFNRQLGARLTTVGRSKVDATARQLLDVNPELKLRRFPEGVTEQTSASFLDGVDLVVDGIDFFAVQDHRMLMAACRRRRIPVILAAPVGFGASVLVFPPEGVSFDEFFRLQNSTDGVEQIVAFGLGLTGGMTSPDVDLERIDLDRCTVVI